LVNTQCLFISTTAIVIKSGGAVCMAGHVDQMTIAELFLGYIIGTLVSKRGLSLFARDNPLRDLSLVNRD
jgi:hypothetical protein